MSMAEKYPAEIRSREGFASFVRALQQECATSQDWENYNLEDYLEAVAAWVEDMDGYFISRGEPIPAQPSWSLFAEILVAARSYE